MNNKTKNLLITVFALSFSGISNDANCMYFAIKHGLIPDVSDNTVAFDSHVVQSNLQKNNDKNNLKTADKLIENVKLIITEKPNSPIAKLLIANYPDVIEKIRKRCSKQH